MLMRLRKGQSTLEYAVVISLVAAALLAMGVYVKRGVEGRLRESTDNIGDQFSAGHTTYNETTSSTVTSTETITGGASPSTSTTSNQSQTVMHNEQTDTFDTEEWNAL